MPLYEEASHLDRPRSARRNGAGGGDNFPDSVMHIQPIAYDEHPDPAMRGHISIGDSDSPEYTCGRRCTFEHAAKQGWNMERATPVRSLGHHDFNPPGTHYLPTGTSDNGGHTEPYPVGQIMRPRTGWMHESARDDHDYNPDYTRCINCGKQTVGD